MKRVVIESPYAGDVERNLRYVRAAMKDCLNRGEAPYASHALYTQEGVLDDTKPAERALGMNAGWEFAKVCDLTVVYTDLGCSSGMIDGIKRSIEAGRPFESRSLGANWDPASWTREQEIAELYKDLARYQNNGQMDAYQAALKELRVLQNEEVEEMRAAANRQNIKESVDFGADLLKNAKAAIERSKTDVVQQVTKEAGHIVVDLKMASDTVEDLKMLPLTPEQIERGKQLLTNMVQNKTLTLKQREDPNQHLPPIEALKTADNFKAWKDGTLLLNTNQKELVDAFSKEWGKLKSEVEDGSVVSYRTPIIDETMKTEEEKFCNEVMGKIWDSRLPIDQIYSYESDGYSHFAVIVGSEFRDFIGSEAIAENAVWSHLREAYKDNPLTKSWLVCMTREEWENYIDRDLYRWSI